MFTITNLRKAIKNPFGAILYLLGIKRHFSQAGEDLILNWMLQKDDGLYIDIGANHPVHGSNTYLFYQKGWKGINIEPNKKMIRKFYSTRSRDLNLQIGIGSANSELTFYVFDEHQMCTCDLETVKRYEKIGHKIVDQYTIPIWTLEKLCDTYIKDKTIDILSIDVEGFDMDVLKSNNWDKYRPTYIILETVEYAKNGKNTWTKENAIFDPYLKSKGYLVIAETGINTIYKQIISND